MLSRVHGKGANDGHVLGDRILAFLVNCFIRAGMRSENRGLPAELGEISAKLQRTQQPATARLGRKVIRDNQYISQESVLLYRAYIIPCRDWLLSRVHLFTVRQIRRLPWIGPRECVFEAPALGQDCDSPDEYKNRPRRSLELPHGRGGFAGEMRPTVR